MDVHGVVCSSPSLCTNTNNNTVTLLRHVVVEHPNAVLLDGCSMTQQGQHPTTQLFVWMVVEISTWWMQSLLCSTTRFCLVFDGSNHRDHHHALETALWLEECLKSGVEHQDCVEQPLDSQDGWRVWWSCLRVRRGVWRASPRRAADFDDVEKQT